MLRVVHLISGDLWAGAEAATCHLLVALARSRQIEVTALLLNDGELARRLRAHPEITVVVEDESRQGFLALARRVRSHCRAADLVHAHRYKENLLAALSGRPWLSTQHGRPEPTAGWRDALARGLVHGLDQTVRRHRARRVVAVSAEVQEWLAGPARQPRTVLVPNGIPDLAAAIAVPPWSERPLRVGALARLFPVKGLDLAIDAIARAPGIELEILGDGPERSALEARARERDCADRVQFRGHVTDPVPHVARWRALLVTSLHEGNPISVLEAIALATPIISGSLRGIADILAGEGGVLVPDRDPEHWARTIESVVGREAVGADLSARARRRFEAAWGVEVTAGAMEKLYNEVLREVSLG